MITLEISPDQADTLATVLHNYLSELRMEISHTDAMDFREGLKSREVVIKEILRQLDSAAEV